MKKTITVFLGGWLLCLSGLLHAQTATPQVPPRITDLKPTVLLISIDGFRWDYFSRYGKAGLPNLHALAARGVRAENMIASFPTKTFPNHYSIVTGMYPGNHGIVANNIYDPATKSNFETSDRKEVQSSRWWGGEPIWVTAEKQGLRTAPMFWPGSEAEIGGTRPTAWTVHDSNATHDQRIAFFLQNLDKPAAERPRFFTLYFQDVDDAGHDHGPMSPEVEQAVSKVDATLGKLLAALDARGVKEKLNIIIVSDHGMTEISPKRQIFLEDFLPPSQVIVADWSPVLALFPGTLSADEIYSRLKNAPHLTVYRKHEIPERYHYGKSPRVAPVIAVADEGWEINTRKGLARRKVVSRGTHGYDNNLMSMRAFFLAAGPAWKQGIVVRPFSNVHIYEAMAKILGVKPAPNDGSLKVLKPAMRAISRPAPWVAPRNCAFDFPIE